MVVSQTVSMPEEGMKTSYKVSAYILLFLILVSIWWIIGFAFNFSFLRCKGKRCNGSVSDNGSEGDHGSNNGSDNSCGRNGRYPYADPGRCLVFAIVISLIILLIIWACVGNKKY